MKVLFLRALYLRLTPKKRERKMELWERDLSAIAKAKINAKIAWRRFDTQTRGMGLVFVIIMFMILIVNIIPFALGKTIQQLDSANYADALKVACKEKDFYNLNFRTCEGVDTRP